MRPLLKVFVIVPIVSACSGGTDTSGSPYPDMVSVVSGPVSYDPVAKTVSFANRARILHDPDDTVVLRRGAAVVTRNSDGSMNAATGRSGDLFAVMLTNDRFGDFRGHVFGDRSGPDRTIAGTGTFTGGYVAMVDDLDPIPVTTPTEFITGDMRLTARFDNRTVTGVIENRVLRSAAGQDIGQASDLRFDTAMGAQGTFRADVAGSLTRNGVTYQIDPLLPARGRMDGLVRPAGAAGVVALVLDRVPLQTGSGPQQLVEHGTFVAD